MVELYLEHHGIMGQKWGVRRFQNEDGSLTDVGRRRLAERGLIDESSGTIKSGKESAARTAIYDEVSKDFRNLSSYYEKGGKAAKALLDIEDRKASQARKKSMSKIDVSEMSDKDLQAAINRMIAERNYKQLKTENINYGRQKVMRRLQTIGEVTAVATSVAGMIASFHELKK